jgi:hypothetical protein
MAKAADYTDGQCTWVGVSVCLCCVVLQMAKTADHIDGSQIGDKEFVEKLIRCVE